MKKLAQILVLGTVMLSSYAFASSIDPGQYMFTNTGNDPFDGDGDKQVKARADLSDQIEAWLKLNTCNIDLTPFIKIDVPSDTTDSTIITKNGNSLYFNDLKSGTWTTNSPVNFYTVKGGNEYAMYWLGTEGASSGSWSTKNLSNNDDNPDISHFSTWTASCPVQTPVPEPATMLLLGTGLVGIAAVRKKQHFHSHL